jgi:hypothetical protein
LSSSTLTLSAGRLTGTKARRSWLTPGALGIGLLAVRVALERHLGPSLSKFPSQLGSVSSDHWKRAADSSLEAVILTHR